MRVNMRIPEQDETFVGMREDDQTFRLGLKGTDIYNRVMIQDQNERIAGIQDGDGNLQLGMDDSHIYGAKTYHGKYEVIPSSEQQVLSTENKVMEQDVVIRPIPSNYGLITWNGAVLTVS